MKEKYLPLHERSICNNCVGCGRLEDPTFRGMKPTNNPDYIPCKNFKLGYSEDELREKNKEYYGSLYNNT